MESSKFLLKMPSRSFSNRKKNIPRRVSLTSIIRFTIRLAMYFLCNIHIPSYLYSIINHAPFCICKYQCSNILNSWLYERDARLQVREWSALTGRSTIWSREYLAAPCLSLHSCVKVSSCALLCLSNLKRN